jgi:hypothetical protein
MNWHKIVYVSLIIFGFVMLYLTGCGFDDPYVPDSVGSSTLSGRIVANPSTDITETEVILKGQESLSAISDANGKFEIDDIIPGDYVLQIRKSPYLQTNLPVSIAKATKDDLGELNIKLQGAISAIIPLNKIGTLYGEFEIVVYVNGVPRVPERNTDGEFIIDLSSTGNDINIRTVTKTIVYIDGTSYSAKVLDGGELLVEFVPPGIYTDIRVKTNISGGTLPISTVPIEVKSGEIRSIKVSVS